MKPTDREAMLKAEQAAVGTFRPFYEGFAAGLAHARGEMVEGIASLRYQIEAREDLGTLLRQSAQQIQADKITKLIEERNCAIKMLAEWVVAIRDNDASWNTWDEHYKDAWFRPCLIRALIDKEILGTNND